jgi:hypothetical protein
MLRSTFKQTAVFALLVGMLFRALTPLGYMPAAPGSGLLFELCPEQIPSGFVFENAGAPTHQHHHGNSDVEQTAEPDQCQIGHLLFSAVAVDQTVAQLDAAAPAKDVSSSPIQTFSRLTISVYQSRAPPHLGNKQINI